MMLATAENEEDDHRKRGAQGGGAVPHSGHNDSVQRERAVDRGKSRASPHHRPLKRGANLIT